MNKKRSRIWFIKKEILEELIKKSTSFGQVLKHFDLVNKGNNNRTLKARCLHDCIDFSHIKIGRNSNKGRKFPLKALSKEKCLEILFIENSQFSRNSVKLYLRKYNLIPYKCICGNVGEWLDKPLSLQIDHINGVSNDHRIENLRWVCPNCHSQTETFVGRHKKSHKPTKL